MSNTIQHTPGRPTATLRDVWSLVQPLARAATEGCFATLDVEPVEGTEEHYYDPMARRELTAVSTVGRALVFDGERGFLWAHEAHGEQITSGSNFHDITWRLGTLVPIAEAFVPADYDVRPALRVVAALLRDALRRNPSLRREAWRLRRIVATLRDMDN